MGCKDDEECIICALAFASVVALLDDDVSSVLPLPLVALELLDEFLVALAF